MLDIFVRAAFYVFMGAALVGACLWYVQSLYRSVTGRDEVIIAPFEVVGAQNKDRGLALAHMLHARLREIEHDIKIAQRELMTTGQQGSPRPSAAASMSQMELSPASAEAVAASTRLAMPQLLTQAVELRAGLLEPTDINITVGGVHVGGVVDWVQRFTNTPRTLVLTLYERKDGAQVSGSLRALSIENEAVRLDVSPEAGQDAVAMDRIVEAVAYEIIRRRLALDDRNRVEVLSGSEFQTLVEVLRDTARMNRRVGLGRGALPQFQDLQSKVTKLADDVPEWYQLNYLAASVAESAKDLEAAKKYFGRVRKTLAKDSRQAVLAESVGKKLDEIQERIAEATPRGGGEDVPDEAMPVAREKIEGYVRAATNYLNSLLGHQLAIPKVRVVVPKHKEDSWISYWDGEKVVVPQATKDIPDIVYRESSWPHILRLAGSDKVNDDSPAEAILYSYADIFPMLVQQHELKQDAATSRWELGPGWVEMSASKDLAKTTTRTPYLSFARLGAPSKGAADGSGQVGHMRDYDAKSDKGTRKYVNSGILNRAFYEAARRLGTDKAAAVWVGALRQMRKVRKLDFPRFAVILSESAEEVDRPKLREALLLVGLDPLASTKPPQ